VNEVAARIVRQTADERFSGAESAKRQVHFCGGPNQRQGRLIGRAHLVQQTRRFAGLPT
jgi:hypothetical protein